VTDLDHIALATTDPAATLGALVGTLGGVCVYGVDGHGFRWMKVHMGNAVEGMTIEVLIAWRPAANDFLARFLARSGSGRHHVTFKVDDFAATLERVRSAGFTPVDVDRPLWQPGLVARADQSPGVDGLEGERSGDPLDLVVSGTRFSIASRSAG